MERGPKESFDSSSTRVEINLSETIELIKNKAASDARAPLGTEESITLFLKSWWSRTYNRPLKDPLLESYTMEELLYEFYDKVERAKAADEQVEQQTDKIEQEKEQKVLDWAAEEEKRELEELRLAEEAKLKENQDPTKDPKNIEWMEEELAKAKGLYGEDFGEDLSLDFNE